MVFSGSDRTEKRIEVDLDGHVGASVLRVPFLLLIAICSNADMQNFASSSVSAYRATSSPAGGEGCFERDTDCTLAVDSRHVDADVG